VVGSFDAQPPRDQSLNLDFDVFWEAWETISQVYCEIFDREDLLPGMICGIQTFGQLVHYHPHIHAIVTDGCFSQDGTFVCLPKIASDRLLRVWEMKVFDFLHAAEKIDQWSVAEMRGWEHSGFSVDNNTYPFTGRYFWY
jgi:hypothetical protein